MANLGDLTTDEVGSDRPRTLLIPLGATEQHGPHLPLSTDTDIALAWCAAIAERLVSERANDVVVAPAMPYGSSGEHQSFAGTLSIGQEAFEHLILELGRSATETFERIVFVSGHAGNARPLERAITTLQHEGRAATALVPLLEGADAHAGRTETSLMLHLHPDRVRMDRAEAGCTEPLSKIIDQLIEGGVAAVSPNGILGDPDGASDSEGGELLSRLVDLALDPLL